MSGINIGAFGGLQILVVKSWLSHSELHQRQLALGRRPRGADWRSSSNRRQWTVLEYVTVYDEPPNMLRAGDVLYCTAKQCATIKARLEP